MSFGTVLLYALEFYAIAGFCTAATFVTFGVTQVLPTPMAFSVGARVLLLPGAFALWPYVLYRWRAAGRPR